MKARLAAATAALILSSPMARAQAVVAGYDKPVSQVDPRLATGASRGALTGTTGRSVGGNAALVRGHRQFRAARRP